MSTKRKASTESIGCQIETMLIKVLKDDPEDEVEREDNYLDFDNEEAPSFLNEDIRRKDRKSHTSKVIESKPKNISKIIQKNNENNENIDNNKGNIFAKNFVEKKHNTAKGFNINYLNQLKYSDISFNGELDSQMIFNQEQFGNLYNCQNFNNLINNIQFNNDKNIVNFDKLKALNEQFLDSNDLITMMKLKSLSNSFLQIEDITNAGSEPYFNNSANFSFNNNNNNNLFSHSSKKRSAASYKLMKDQEFNGSENNTIESLLRFAERIEENGYLILKGNFTKIAKSQNGSRSLQKIVKKTNKNILTLILEEILPDLPELIVDSYANYFCQKLYATLTFKDRLLFLDKISPCIVEMCKTKIGTFTFQTFIEHFTTDEEKKAVGDIFKGNIAEMCLVKYYLLINFF
jgi:hypothetical protein